MGKLLYIACRTRKEGYGRSPPNRGGKGDDGLIKESSVRVYFL